MWDDGTAASGGTVVGNGPIYTVFASHSYASAGSDAIEVLVGQAAGLAAAAATALVQPNWYNGEYELTLDVSRNGRLSDLLPGKIQNGVENYLPGQSGNRPDIGTKPLPKANDLSMGQLPNPMTVDAQAVNLYLTGVTKTLADSAGVDSVSFQFAKGQGPKPWFYQGYQVSNLPGYAGNAVVVGTSVSPQVSPNQADYSFDPNIDTWQAPGKIDDKATTTTLYVKDYGGEAAITAKLLDDKGNVLHTFMLTVPVDTNHNHIADAWQIAQAQLIPGLLHDPTVDPSIALDYFKNPNLDENIFPNMTNRIPSKNPPYAFPDPSVAKLELGDGIPLSYEYRGVVIDGGGFDPNGKSPLTGSIPFVRLSPVYKNVLVSVDTQTTAGKKLKNAGADEKTILDMVSKAYSQAKYGAGIRLYYAFNPRGTWADKVFRGNGTTPEERRNNMQIDMRDWVQSRRGDFLGVSVFQYWRNLTIATTSNMTGFSDKLKKQFLELQSSGFSSSAGQEMKYRGGSFLFVQDANTMYEKVFKKARATFLKARGETQTLNFNTFLAGVIIHEVAHQLLSSDGHYKDADGDGNSNRASDFQTVQFDYTQDPATIPGYNYQDYYPLPGQTFKFAHGFVLFKNLDWRLFLRDLSLGPTTFLEAPPK